MKKRIIPINDPAIIEKKLRSEKVGFLAFRDNEGRQRQFLSPYLYRDKNIFIPAFPGDEALVKVALNDFANFSISAKVKLEEKPDNNFSLLQINCYGVIKKLEDAKSIERIDHLFRKKYLKRKKNDSDEECATFDFLYLDTEELQASAVIGG